MPVRRRLPLAVKVQASIVFALVGIATVISYAVERVLVERTFEEVAFAMPVIQTAAPAYLAEERFGDRMHQALGIRESTAHEFAGWILEAATRQDIQPELIASLILTESSFRKNVVSFLGAVGPAQVRPEYWSSFCASDDLMDPAENIYCGAQILAYFQDRCGGDVCALEAYNIGLYGNRAAAARRYVSKVDSHRIKLTDFSS